VGWWVRSKRARPRGPCGWLPLAERERDGLGGCGDRRPACQPGTGCPSRDRWRGARLGSWPRRVVGGLAGAGGVGSAPRIWPRAPAPGHVSVGGGCRGGVRGPRAVARPASRCPLPLRAVGTGSAGGPEDAGGAGAGPANIRTPDSKSCRSSGADEYCYRSEKRGGKGVGIWEPTCPDEKDITGKGSVESRITALTLVLG